MGTSTEQLRPQPDEAQPQLFDVEPLAPADDSLLTFEAEEDLEFDPLKRSDSTSQSNSGKKSESALASDTTSKPPPLRTQESLGHIQDLTGVDLSLAASTAGGGGATTAPPPQDSLRELLQPLQTSSGMQVPVTLMVASSASMGGTVPPQGITVQSGGVAQVPLGIQAGVVGGGVAYRGGAQTIVPVMYAAQGTPGMMYQVSILAMILLSNL